MATSDPIAHADALLAKGQPNQAIAAIDAAARSGHAEARFRQAIWRLIGSPVPRDLSGARVILRSLAASGHAEAQLIEVALAANGSGSAPDWRQALAYLRDAAPLNGGAKAQLAIVEAMDVDATGAPRQRFVHQDLAPGSRVQRVSGFLTPTECAHITQSAVDLLAPAHVVDPTTGRQIPHPIRTSDGAVIGPVREDLAIRAINRRIGAISDTDVDAGEALTVLRYRPGQQFRMHSDALPGTRNQRVKTVLVYLNDGYDGGETTFPDYDLKIRPVAGDAIIFTNTLPDGRPDPRARHAGLPVASGVKWLATRWIRARPFDVWSGPEPRD